MSEKRLLSICIPTYNQPKELSQTLHSLVGQDLNDIIIVIKDDNSDNETQSVIESFRDQLPLQHYRGHKNGVDNAFLYLTENVQTEYIWWFGDDLFLPGAIKAVIETLKLKPDIDFMYINSTDISKKHFSISAEQSFYFNDSSEALFKLSDQLGFCSALLFRKSIVVQGISESKKFIGTHWVTLFLAIYSLSVAQSIYFLHGLNFMSAEKVSGETRWYDSFTVHCINYYTVVWNFKNVFDRKLLRKILAEKFHRSWMAVIVERAKGFTTGFASPNPKIFPMIKCYWSYPEMYVALPLMMLPRSILQLMYQFFTQVRARLCAG